MALVCTVMGHEPGAQRHRNQGLEFAPCHRCACDLIRIEGADAWTEVPEGFRVVWREFGRSSDAAAVAARMARMAAPAAQDSTPPPRRRARRGRPVRGAAAMAGALARLGELMAGEDDQDSAVPDHHGQYVICLPGPAPH